MDQALQECRENSDAEGEQEISLKETLDKSEPGLSSSSMLQPS